MYSNNLLDPSLTASIQTMSAKLLLNMIDKIMKLPDHTESRHVLILILKCFANRVADLNDSLVSIGVSLTESDVSHQLKEQGIYMGMPPSEQEVDPVKGKVRVLMTDRC